MPPAPVFLVRPAYPLGTLAFINTQIPLNLCLLAANLRAHGFPDVRIVDYEVSRFDREAFQEIVREARPSLIGITACTPTVHLAQEIAEAARAASPGTFLVAGGPHVSALPKQTLEEGSAWDAAVVGEGEETLLEVCRVLAAGDRPAGVDGLVVREDGGIRENPHRALMGDLDRLPLPARDLLALEAYRGQVFRGFSRDYLRIGELITSRGCPNSCVFCASKVAMGRRVRYRSAGNVMEEVRECVQRYGIRHFCILDDTFNLNRDRLFALCRAFRELDVTWNCLATVSHMTRETLVEMQRGGCVGITFGIESGSPRVLGLNGKNVTREQAVRVFRWAREAGIKTLEADFMIGSHPSETPEDLLHTKSLIRELRPDILSVQPLIPYPGTRAYAILAEKGLLGTTRWKDFVFFGTRPTWRLEHLDADDLLRYQKRLLRGFYYRPRNIARRLKKISGWGELAYYLKVGLNILRRV